MSAAGGSGGAKCHALVCQLMDGSFVDLTAEACQDTSGRIVKLIMDCQRVTKPDTRRYPKTGLPKDRYLHGNTLVMLVIGAVLLLCFMLVLCLIRFARKMSQRGRLPTVASAVGSDRPGDGAHRAEPEIMMVDVNSEMVHRLDASSGVVSDCPRPASFTTLSKVPRIVVMPDASVSIAHPEQGPDERGVDATAAIDVSQPQGALQASQDDVLRLAQPQRFHFYRITIDSRGRTVEEEGLPKDDLR